jgi:AbrB family looped-hinge helix DNA binding protein
MKLHANKFLGITTLGEKGQVVVPAEARLRMKLKTGDKLMVMSPHEGALVLMKTSHFEAFARNIMKRLDSIKKLTRKGMKK